MDGSLRRVLNWIAHDRTSGAAELARRGVRALEAWLRRRSKPTEAELLEIARTLLDAQPAMAPLVRLANEVALAAEREDRGSAVAQAVGKFRHLLESAPARISRQFQRALRRRPRWQLATYSYSSTVVHALRRARSRVDCVYCSEGRPGYEGRATAEKLAEAGIRVFFLTDAALWSRIGEARAFVSGADAILAEGIVNKIGTQPLIAQALEAGRHVWVLADTTKFLPEALARAFRRAREAAPGEIWRKPAKGVRVLNPYFECAEISTGVRVLTERGWMGPRAVRREIAKIQISPRLVPSGSGQVAPGRAD